MEISLINIEEINRKHFIETDIHYRICGLSSKLFFIDNLIFSLEVIINKKWDKDYSQTASEIASVWHENHTELKNMVGCKIYIIDTKKYPYKKLLLNSGIKPNYDAKKGVLFEENYLN